MTELDTPRERLAAILAGDVAGYSRLMRDDERATLALLDEYRGVFRAAIGSHGGRVVDMSGDSVLAVFETAAGAVTAATEAQAELARRNEALPEERRMLFRVGVNLGDILEKPDGSVYGDGVNVAARLQATADAGGINVSGTVFESVRSKLRIPFAFLGEQHLKNIADPIAVYHLGALANHVAGSTGSASGKGAGAGRNRERPIVAVMPLKVISGGDEVRSLAEALRDELVGSLTKQTAIAVVMVPNGEAVGTANGDATDFRLEGSIQVVGSRIRLFFTLFEAHAGAQVWSERYTRDVDDFFELEDEISLNVAATIRIRIKARTFERLRNTLDEALSVPELLSKAAGYFVSSHGHNEEAAAALETALARAPDNAMAIAMKILCRYRQLEFSVFDVPESAKREFLAEAERALANDPSSFFAHLVAAIVHQDLLGDFETALVHAEASLGLNSGFSQASAMAGIAHCHLGETEMGLRLLNRAIAAAPDDPHRFRHLRELALVHFMLGDATAAATVVNRLVHQAPDLLRNQLVSVSLLWHAGRGERAKQCVEDLRKRHAGLDLRSMRPVRFTDPAAATRFTRGLAEAGLAA